MTVRGSHISKELSHIYCIKIQVRKSNTTSLLSIMLLLIERHVLAYSEAIVRFCDCQPQDVNISCRNGWLDVDIHHLSCMAIHIEKFMNSVASEISESVSQGYGGDANYSMGSSPWIQMPCCVWRWGPLCWWTEGINEIQEV